jgi:DNA-binding PadR family transcriptional regulator
MSINNTPETRAFLSVLNAMDGPATMADIRKRTSLNEDKRHYQFKKLEKAGLIKITYNKWGGTSTAPMKQATLTESGKELLDSGFLDENTSEFERANVDVVELSSEVKELRETIERLRTSITENVYEPMVANQERINGLEEQLSD